MISRVDVNVPVESDSTNFRQSADKSVIPTFAEGVGSVFTAFLQGGVVGGCCFLGFRLIQRIGFMSNAGHFELIPHVLFFAVDSTISKTAELTYLTALHVLGDRHDYENAPDPATLSGQMRKRVWRCVTLLDKLQKNVDVVYSRVFQIRTQEQIDLAYPQEKDYYSAKPALMEVVRKVFFKQIFATVSTLRSSFGVYAFGKMGLTLMFPLLSVKMHVYLFFVSLASKVAQVFDNVMRLEQDESVRRPVELDDFVVSTTR